MSLMNIVRGVQAFSRLIRSAIASGGFSSGIIRGTIVVW